jgi:hypothetical protein
LLAVLLQATLKSAAAHPSKALRRTRPFNWPHTQLASLSRIVLVLLCSSLLRKSRLLCSAFSVSQGSALLHSALHVTKSIAVSSSTRPSLGVAE